MTRKSPLGKPTDYVGHYAPELLHPVARRESRSALGLDAALPFTGVDIWNAWELTWLDALGKPKVGMAVIRVPADSTNIVESKSLKLYLNSFAMTKFANENDVAGTIRKDLSDCVEAEVTVQLRRAESTDGRAVARLPGECLDDMPLDCDVYEVDPKPLRADSSKIVREDLYSHLLRSLCPVTNQPDTGSVLITYKGPRIERESLLRYIVSYREHNDFHENCVEQMFVDIRERCEPEQLSVYARYQRRGGIDINPFRSNFESNPPNARLWRQ